MPTQKAADIDCKFELIDDFILAKQPPLADRLEDRFLAVQVDPKANENLLLSVSPQNELVLYAPDPKSPSSWSQTSAPVPGAPGGDVKKLVGFWSDQSLHALVHYQNPRDAKGTNVIVLNRKRDGGWKVSKLDSTTETNLGSTRQMGRYISATGDLLIYGVSTNYEEPHFFIATHGRQGWRNLHREQIVDAGQAYGIVSGKKRGELKVVESSKGKVRLRGATFRAGRFKWVEGDVTELDLDCDIAEVRSFESPKFSESILVRATDGSLILVSGYTGRNPLITRLSGLPDGPERVRAVESGRDAAGRTITFAIDNGQRLWILRQSGRLAGRSKRLQQDAFDPWVELGNRSASIACPPTMGDAGEIFIAGVSRQVERLGQDSKSLVWTSTTLQVPRPKGDKPDAASTYSVEITAHDKAGRAVPHSVVEVRSDRMTTIYGNGLAYNVDRNHGALFETDNTGTLTVIVKADDLIAPELLVNVKDFMRRTQYRSVRPDQHVHTRLAGKDPNFKISAAAMKKAGALPPKLPDRDAGEVVKALQATSEFLVEKAREAEGAKFRASALQNSRWRLVARPDGRLRFEALDRKALAGHRRRLMAAQPRQAVRGGAGDIWGDFVNWFVKTAKAFVEFIVEIVGGVVKILITIGKTVYDFIVDTVPGAGKVFDAIFSGLKAFYETAVDLLGKAIKWLGLDLLWKDVLLDSDVLGSLVAKTLTGMSGFARNAGEAVEGVFDDMIGSVDKTFDDLEKSLGSATLESLFAGGKSTRRRGSRGGGPLEDDTVAAIHDKEAVRCNYLINRMPKDDAALAFPTLPSAQARAANDFFDSLYKALPMDRLQRSMRKINAQLKRMKDGGDFLRSGLTILLELLKDVIILILTAFKKLVRAFLDLAAAGIDAIKKFLQAEFYIPVISEIVAVVTGGRKLSLMLLISLLIALPLTTISKILTGKRAFEGVSPKRVAGNRDLRALAGKRTTVLPILYTIRTLSYAAQYAMTYAAPPAMPANKALTYVQRVELGCLFVCVAIENFPDFGDDKVAGAVGRGEAPLGHPFTPSNLLLAISALIAALYFFKVEEAAKTVEVDTAVNFNRGIINLIAAIVFTLETYGGPGKIGPNERAKMAGSYLGTFPMLFLAGALNPEPVTSAILGVIGTASYGGAAVASGFLEVNL